MGRKRFEGKVAVVTGAGRGIGEAYARGLAEEGAAVVVSELDADQGQRVAVEIEGAGGKSLFVETDVSSEDSCRAMGAAARDAFGGVDVLVNNAVLRPMKGWSGDSDQFRRSVEVNVTGVFLMTRVFGEAMAERGGGSIINVGSIQGLIGPDFSLYEDLGMDPAPDYYVHKGGMMQLTRYAAAKLGPRGVRVNTVSPGGLFNDQNPEFVRRYNRRTFLGRMANHTDLKGPIVFLASDASAYVTGATLAVDGGYTAK